MTSSIVGLLSKHGPSLTSELIEHLVAEGVSPAAARQRITRAKSQYTRLAGIRLEKNSRFIYLESQYGTFSFWSALERAFYEKGKSYWAAIVGLKARGGRCPKHMFPSICGAPIARKRQLSPDRILERLVSIQMLKEVSDQDSEETIIELNPYSYEKDSNGLMRAILIAENVALHGIKDYARKLGFGSYNKFNMRGEDEPPIVSGVQWDLCAPSYMRPLVDIQKGQIKPGFIVYDINLHEQIGVDEVKVFIRKHDMASAPLAVAPIMPFLLGNEFSEEGYSLARKYGILATKVSHLFGEETAKALRDLIGLLSDTGATASVNPEHLYNVLQGLTKIEGAANNLRGALFELAIGALVKDVEGGYLVTGEKRKDYETGRFAEIDVLLDRDEKSVLVVECKSKIPSAEVSLEEVKKWYSDRVPLIFNILRDDDRYENRKFRFELWSNGSFEEEASMWFRKQEKNFDGYSVGTSNGDQVRKYARKATSSSIRKILNEHYFKHPLVKIKNKSNTHLAKNKNVKPRSTIILDKSFLDLPD